MNVIDFALFGIGEIDPCKRTIIATSTIINEMPENWSRITFKFL